MQYTNNISLFFYACFQLNMWAAFQLNLWILQHPLIHSIGIAFYSFLCTLLSTLFQSCWTSCINYTTTLIPSHLTILH